MEWVTNLVAKHTDGEAFDAEAFNAEFATVFAKNAVPKAEFNARGEELRAARKALTEAEAADGDAEKIRAALTEATAAREKAEADLAAHVKGATIRDALRDAGGTDLDYLAYKLGDVGDDKDLANKVKDLAGSLPSFFKVADAEKPDTKGGGYQAIDNGLKGGNATDAEKAAVATFEKALGL